ncbi:hypothetical protein ACA910_012356 [Epithemia clementina (nom. ined.)]
MDDRQVQRTRARLLYCRRRCRPRWILPLVLLLWWLLLSTTAGVLVVVAATIPSPPHPQDNQTTDDEDSVVRQDQRQERARRKVYPNARRLTALQEQGKIGNRVHIQFEPRRRNVNKQQQHGRHNQDTDNANDDDDTKDIAQRAQRTLQRVGGLCTSVRPTFGFLGGGANGDGNHKFHADHVQAKLHYYYVLDCSAAVTSTNDPDIFTTMTTSFSATNQTTAASREGTTTQNDSSKTKKAQQERGAQALEAMALLQKVQIQEREKQASSRGSAESLVAVANHQEEDDDDWLGIAVLEAEHQIITLDFHGPIPSMPEINPQTHPELWALRQQQQQQSRKQWNRPPHAGNHYQTTNQHEEAEQGGDRELQSPLPLYSQNPDDLYYATLNYQSHYNAIGLPAAWQYMEEQHGWGNPATPQHQQHAIVHVLDAGWDLSHVDLGLNKWINPGEICGNGVDDDDNGYVDDCYGYNFADDLGNDQLLGDGSHGTHVSGTIAANTDNDGVGVAGVAGGAKGGSSSGGGRGVAIMTGVAFGQTNEVGFAESLVYAADNGATISSNSWGYSNQGYYEDHVKAAIDYAVNKGVLVVFAAGNENSNRAWYPAYFSNVLAVSATYNNGHRASFTNYGDWVDIAAPGINIMSTVAHGNGYDTMSGTSMACPHVSAVLAMGKSLRPNVTAEELRSCLLSTAQPLTDKSLGAGMVDPLGFLKCVNKDDDNNNNDDDGILDNPTTAPSSTAPGSPTTSSPTAPGSPTTSSPTTPSIPNPPPIPSPSRAPITQAPFLGSQCETCGDCQQARPLGSGEMGCQCPTCQDLVCDLDPFCCHNEWDALCANEAKASCPCTCEDGQCGDCLDVRGTQGCSCPSCEQTVCDILPFCCNDAWSITCASAASTACSCSNSGGTSSPATMGPAAVAWPTESPTFATSSATMTPTLTALPTNTLPPTDLLQCEENHQCGNCQIAHSTEAGGCSCPECEMRVCAWDWWCCSAAWDNTCAHHAQQFCTCQGDSNCASASCTSRASWAGCPSCPTCQQAVCGEDPYCCTVQWDDVCANAASDMCL